MANIPRLSNLVWLGFAAAAGMVIGGFGPWGKVVGLVNTSISGTDGSNDGWIVVGACRSFFTSGLYVDHPSPL